MTPLAHRLVRRVARRYPSLRGTGLVTRTLDRMGLSERTGTWMRGEAFAECPAMELDLRDPFQRRVFYFPNAHRRHYLPPALRAEIERHVSPGATFLDIGANLGFLTMFASRRVGPHGRVIAFEPEPTTFASLSRSAALQPFANITCLPVALSDADRGEQALFQASSGTAHSLHAESTEHADRYRGSTTVRVTSLDALVASGQLALANIAFAKIDVEGNEASVLAGMTATLASSKYPPIWVEVRGPQGSTRAPSTFAKVMSVVEPLGYRAYRLGPRAEREVAVHDVIGREDILLRCPR